MRAVLEALISALIAAAVSVGGSWLVYRGQSEATLSAAESEFRTKLMERVERLEEAVAEKSRELHEAELKIAELERRVSEQFDHIGVLESFHDHVPGPCWLKDTAGRMYFINAAYEREWGVSRLKYEGRYDRDIWPPEVAEAFVAHDQHVLAEMRGIEAVEFVPDRPDAATGREWVIWKFPVMREREVVGVGGIALRPKAGPKDIEEGDW